MKSKNQQSLEVLDWRMLKKDWNFYTRDKHTLIIEDRGIIFTLAWR